MFFHSYSYKNSCYGPAKKITAYSTFLLFQHFLIDITFTLEKYLGLVIGQLAEENDLT